MAADWSQEILALGSAAGTVAAVAVPVGIVARVWSRRAGEAILPPCRRPIPRWNGPAIIFLFLAASLLPGIVAVVLNEFGFYRRVLPSNTVWREAVPAFVAVGGGSAAEAAASSVLRTHTRMDSWARLLAVPLLLLIGQSIRRSNEPDGPPSRRRWSADVVLGVVGWAVLTPIVFAVHILTNWAMTQLGDQPDVHPLARLGGADRTLDVFVFLFSAGVLVPLAEEYTFRGALLPWATRKRFGPAVVLAVAAAFVVNSTLSADSVRIAPLIFMGFLALGLFCMYRMPGVWLSCPGRSMAAVYSTAAFFAAVHSGVWPTPVPLFFLGLGLGYLVARTGSIMPAVIVHGLFNIVSAVLVLRGDPAG